MKCFLADWNLLSDWNWTQRCPFWGVTEDNVRRSGGVRGVDPLLKIQITKLTQQDTPKQARTSIKNKIIPKPSLPSPTDFFLIRPLKTNFIYLKT